MPSREVAIVQAFIPHYRSGFYVGLRDLLEASGVRLRVLVGTPVGSETGMHDLLDLDWFERLDNRTLGIAGREAWWQAALGPTRSSDLVVVEQATKRLVNYPLLARQRFGGARVALWGHGRTPTWEPPDGQAPVDALKRRMSNAAHWWFAYNELTTRILVQMGYPAERVTDVQNAIDTSLLREALVAEQSIPLAQRRASRGIGSGPVAIYCGRLYAEKRIDYLLEAAAATRREVPDFELVVVGDGPERGTVDTFARHHPWVHAVGAKLGPDRVPWFGIADVCLMPAFAGLTIVDSFAMETPMVASRSAAHGPEILYLDDRNGAFVNDGGQPEVFGKAVAELVCDAPRLERLREGCRTTAEGLTIENMARRFHDGVLQALEAAPR